MFIKRISSQLSPMVLIFFTFTAGKIYAHWWLPNQMWTPNFTSAKWIPTTAKDYIYLVI